MQEVIVTKGLWYVYPEGMKVLRGVDLTIHERQFVAIVGPNGAGKTTLAKHFNGLLKPTRGSVYVYGQDTRNLNVAKLSTMVGYVFQNPDHMLFAKTIEKEVAYGPRNLKLPEKEIKKRVNLALKTLGLLKYRKESPFFFGKGIRRKVTLAAVLAMEPKILVIDEPTLGMGYRDSVEMMNLLKKLHQEGHTIVIITHDMRIVADYAERAIVMNDGKVIYDGSIRELFLQKEFLDKACLKPLQITRLARKLDKFEVPPIFLRTEELYHFFKLKSLTGSFKE